MKSLLIIFSLFIFISCKKKDKDSPDTSNIPSTTTTGQNPLPQNYVNGYFIINKPYNFNIVAGDTLYNKSYFVYANTYNTAVNIITSIGVNDYSGALYCNGDSLFYSSDGYVTYPTPPTPPFVWGFTNSPIFGTNNVTTTDTCSNLSKANVYAINDSISISQNFVFNLITISAPFTICTITYQNYNTGQSGISKANFGDANILIPASNFVTQVNDSASIIISLINDTYKTVNGKSVLFRNSGNYTKTIKVVP